MIPCQNSQALKRKSTGASSNHSSTDEPQQTPPTRVRISSSATTPDGSSYQHAFEPSAEFKTYRDNLYKIMPQEPHLQQLDKNSSSSARKGFRLVLDMDFVNLAQKLTGPVDPVEFSKGIDEYASQLATLEQNGYNVVKLWEKFDKLTEISLREKKIGEEQKEKEDEWKDKHVKACITLNKIESLKKELKALEATAKFQEDEIQTLKLIEMSYAEERKKNLEQLSAVASAPW